MAPSPVGQDHYAVLGVTPSASMRQITSAYRALARMLHPDARPEPADAQRFAEVAAAYEVLHDPTTRAAYDAAHPIPRSAPAGAATTGRRPVRVRVRVVPTAYGSSIRPTEAPLASADLRETRPTPSSMRAGPVRVTPYTRPSSRGDEGDDDAWDWALQVLRWMNPWP